ncbi:MAG: hypothetical protein ACM3MG_02555 [Bacillota bacterium]
MKHLIIATLVLLSLKSWADGGNGVERIELPAEVRARVASYLTSHCGLQMDQETDLSVSEFTETDDSIVVTVQLAANVGEEKPVVRMKFAKVNAFSQESSELMLVESNYQGICK